MSTGSCAGGRVVRPIKKDLDGLLRSNQIRSLAELEAWLKERSHSIVQDSTSTAKIGRKYKDTSHNLADLKALTATVGELDDEGRSSQMLVRIGQALLLKLAAIINDSLGQRVDALEVDRLAGTVSKLTRAIAELGRVDTLTSKFLAELADSQEEALLKVSEEGEQKGINPEFLDYVKTNILKIHTSPRSETQ